MSGVTIGLTDPMMTRREPGRWWTSANTAEVMQGVLWPLVFTCQRTDDREEAQSVFREKRRPRFTGR